MKIAVTNPNTSARMTAGMLGAARRAAAADVEIVAGQSGEGPDAIEGPFDGALAVPGMLRAMLAAEAAGADAHVIACFDDTGLDAARAALERPVVGIGEAAMHVVSLVAASFAIVTTLARSVPILRDNARRYGLGARCTAVLASDIPVLALHDPASGAQARLSRLVGVAREGGAEGIVLGCAGMAEFAHALEEEHGLPVIEGVSAAIGLSAALVRTGARTSRAGLWARPTRRAVLGAAGS
ncbi:MAG: aspartate/glutamate racemase family protein [Rhodobacteraceae bacterium]|nr:aspartate/glutamate racemase family protein [Paracoccaceae bacterium]